MSLQTVLLVPTPLWFNSGSTIFLCDPPKYSPRYTPHGQAFPLPPHVVRHPAGGFSPVTLSLSNHGCLYLEPPRKRQVALSQFFLTCCPQDPWNCHEIPPRSKLAPFMPDFPQCARTSSFSVLGARANKPPKSVKEMVKITRTRSGHPFFPQRTITSDIARGADLPRFAPSPKLATSPPSRETKRWRRLRQFFEASPYFTRPDFLHSWLASRPVGVPDAKALRHFPPLVK